MNEIERDMLLGPTPELALFNWATDAMKIGAHVAVLKLRRHPETGMASGRGLILIITPRSTGREVGAFPAFVRTVVERCDAEWVAVYFPLRLRTEAGERTSLGLRFEAEGKKARTWASENVSVPWAATFCPAELDPDALYHRLHSRAVCPSN